MRFRGIVMLTVIFAVMIALVANFGCSSPTPTPTVSPTAKPTTTASPAPPPKTEAAPAVRLGYGAGAASGAAYPIHVAISRAVAKYAPNIQITLMETAGGADNWKRVQDGSLQVGNFSTTDWYEIYNGVGAQVGKQNANIRGLFPIRGAPFNYVVRKDSNIYALKDLDGKKFNPGPKGGTAEVQSRALLQALGIKPDLFLAERQEAYSKYRDGVIVGFEDEGPAPVASLTELALTAPFRLLGLTEQDWQIVSKALPGLLKITIAANSYSGQDKPILSVGNIAAVGTTKDSISVDVAYQLTRSYCLGFDEFVRPMHKVFASVTSPEEFIMESAKSPLHAGVIKWLREKNKTIPDYLIPPEAK